MTSMPPSSANPPQGQTHHTHNDPIQSPNPRTHADNDPVQAPPSHTTSDTVAETAQTPDAPKEDPPKKPKGKPLSEWMKQPQPALWCYAFFEQICKKVEEAHKNDFIHAAFTPEKIRLLPEPKLTDVIDLEPPPKNDPNDPDALPPPPKPLHPPDSLYAPPEAADPDVLLDGRADVYSLGIIFYEALTGQIPLQIPPPPLAEICPERKYFDGLDEVLQKAVEADREDRHPSVAHFLTALKEAHEIAKGPKSFKWKDFRKTVKKKLVKYLKKKMKSFVIKELSLYIKQLFARPKAPKDSAQQAARESAKQAAKQSAKQAAKQAARESAKQAAKQVAKQAAQQAMQEIAKQAAQAAVRQAATVAYSTAAAKSAAAAASSLSAASTAAAASSAAASVASAVAAQAAGTAASSAAVAQAAGTAATSVAASAAAAQAAGTAATSVAASAAAAQAAATAATSAISSAATSAVISTSIAVATKAALLAAGVAIGAMGGGEAADVVAEVPAVQRVIQRARGEAALSSRAIKTPEQIALEGAQVEEKRKAEAVKAAQVEEKRKAEAVKAAQIEEKRKAEAVKAAQAEEERKAQQACPVPKIRLKVLKEQAEQITITSEKGQAKKIPLGFCLPARSGQILVSHPDFVRCVFRVTRRQTGPFVLSMQKEQMQILPPDYCLEKDKEDPR